MMDLLTILALVVVPGLGAAFLWRQIRSGIDDFLQDDAHWGDQTLVPGDEHDR